MVAMPRDTGSAGGDRLLSYAIASGDMWYVEIGERDIYLRNEPQQGLLVEGEIPQRGPGSYANLSQVLLEYCSSCEACRGDAGASAQDCEFAARLGRQLIAKLEDLLPKTPNIDRVSATMDIILNSMGVTYEKDLTADGLRYDLADAPIDKAASGSGLRHWGPMAQRAFMALATFVVRSAAPDWVFVPPAEPEAHALWIIPSSSAR